MWLRDSLPYDLNLDANVHSSARVMIYGYESSVSESSSVQNLEDLTTSFNNALLELIPSSKPVILVAHSLGGLIVKQVSL
jgi:protein SERAC1